MQVLSPLDSAFLRLESPSTSVHIASVAVFAGPPPDPAELLSMFAARLPRLPRYRQVVREVPLWVGRPVWVDDPDFDLSSHLRLAHLPAPGNDRQLRELVGELMSVQLDRARPLWQEWAITGLTGDRWALLGKVHHCIVDGVAGTDLLTALLDHSPTPAPADLDDWQPESTPGRLSLLRHAMDSVPRRPDHLSRDLLQAVRHPRHTAGAAGVRLRGLAGFAALARPAGPSSLSGPLHPQRSWSWAGVDLADIRTIRKALGGTVNDVVLAAVTAGFRALLLARGETPARQLVRSLVPVSVRTSDEHGQADNRVSALVADLPVIAADPLERFELMRSELDRLKRSGEAAAGQLITDLGYFTPALLVNAGLSLGFRLPQRALITVTTNVPGPRIPLYALGRRLLEIYPYVPIANRVRIGVAITSYLDQITIGVTADRASTPDLATLVDGITTGFTELLSLAESP